MIGPVVDAAWTQARRHELVFADVRWYLDGRSGRAAYDAEHIAGAVFVDLDAWLAGPASTADGRHPLPDPAVFARGMAQLGIGDDTTVVAYDDAGGTIAARLVWLLRAVGREAALLDGGIAAWDGPLETAAPAIAPARFTTRSWPPELLASANDAADERNLVLDARQGERYRGQEEPIDPRPGHIPGAISLPCREHLAADGCLLAVAELRARLSEAGVGDGRPVVSYCGSGVTACHTLLVIEHAGLGGGRLYPGSWSQWSHDPARPAERIER